MNKTYMNLYKCKYIYNDLKKNYELAIWLN